MRDFIVPPGPKIDPREWSGYRRFVDALVGELRGVVGEVMRTAADSDETRESVSRVRSYARRLGASRAAQATLFGGGVARETLHRVDAAPVVDCETAAARQLSELLASAWTTTLQEFGEDGPGRLDDDMIPAREARLADVRRIDRLARQSRVSRDVLLGAVRNALCRALADGHGQLRLPQNLFLQSGVRDHREIHFFKA